MDRLKPATVADARDFFAMELRTVMGHHGVSATPPSFDYLVGLLVKTISSDNFFKTNEAGHYEETLVFDLYIEYTQAPLEQKAVILQRIGDLCLLVSGYFSDSLKSKLVDLDYYFGMGGTAYRTLADLQTQNASRAVYAELSGKFQPYSNILGEMSERNGLQSNKDLLRLYERWMVTGSDRLRKILGEYGIQPINSQKGPKQ
ncbi:MAG: hypothetical protein EB078_00515 [Proteobacteria bacterium]|nr:hypothetical protein [Pseudomonadota bacterium]NDC23566.1 hypothetical protein [Pseudomonadota bacterium]NDD03362.1 hypothetical protein [Pseudomonadota bacterium]NDG25729.1 hypothetical protein [Pseudomonadota bacterium]